MSAKRIPLTFKRTAFGGKYYAEWTATKVLNRGGTEYRILVKIEQRWDRSGKSMQWRADVNGRSVDGGVERGSNASLPVVKESAVIAVSDAIPDP